MKRMKLNAAWHAKHIMPPRPTLDQRMCWHVAHAEHCRCRPIPPTLRALIRAWRARKGRQNKRAVS